MVKSRLDLIKWALSKADQYIGSAKDNIDKERLFPAAEDIFKAQETLLEALLYHYGVKNIEYPGKIKKFTGRLALQFLVRDILLFKKRIDRSIYDKYFSLASELHLGGYEPSKMFNKEELNEDLIFIENFFIKVKSITGV